MNNADQNLIEWLNAEINSGKRTNAVPERLLMHTTSEGLAEARRLAKLCEVKLSVRA